MPTLISVEKMDLEWTDILAWEQRPYPVSAQKRSPGVHLSGIIRAVLQHLGKLKLDEEERDLMPLCMAVGMAWENWVVGLDAATKRWRIKWQPGEWEKDGVFGTPDGRGRHIEYKAKVLAGGHIKKSQSESECLDEFKCTWKSEHTRKNIVEETLWVWQLAANCYALGLEVARLHVLWVNGDYRPPTPKYMVYTMRFDRSELEQFWRNVVITNKGIAKPEKGQN